MVIGPVLAIGVVVALALAVAVVIIGCGCYGVVIRGGGKRVVAMTVVMWR